MFLVGNWIPEETTEEENKNKNSSYDDLKLKHLGVKKKEAYSAGTWAGSTISLSQEDPNHPVEHQKQPLVQNSMKQNFKYELICIKAHL